MAKQPYYKINTLQMQYFIETVERGSFTNAAKILFSTQSTLSKNIAQLEEELNVELFYRYHKKLVLTDAGKLLYNCCKKMLLELDKSVEECRVLQGGYSNMLSIGVLDSHNPESFALPSIRKFREKNPNTNITVNTCSAQEIRDRIINGDMDIAYTVLYDVEQYKREGLDYINVSECPHEAVVLKSNPLAGRECLDVSELKNLDFIAISPLYTPSYVATLNALCAEYGFEPNYIRYVNSATALSYNLSGPDEIFIADKHFKDYKNDIFSDHVFIPLNNTSSGIAAVWSRMNNKTELKQFLKQLINVSD